jgi:FkbM family methyltransferase
MRVYFQIGANTGADTFQRKVRNEKPDLTILVEPNAEFESVIRSNYAGVPNVYILSKAIYYENKPVSLFIPAKRGVYGTRADNGFTYEHTHFSLVPMNDWGDKSDMVELKTDGITFDTVCRVFGLTAIDYLQIDTEGFDSEILKIIDLSKVDIRQIRYEQWNFESKEFTRHNTDRAQSLGKGGMREVEEKLTRAGYLIREIRDEDGQDWVATKT